jgi:hypothetical protein
MLRTSSVPCCATQCFREQAWWLSSSCHCTQFEAAEKGRIDLLLVADDGTAPAHFAKEVIVEVDFVCVMTKESSFGRGLTLKQYLAAGHIGIDIVGGIQTIPEKRLAAIGAKRHCPMVISYHTTAMRSVIGTNLVATVPRRIEQLEASNPSARIVNAPAVLGEFKYLRAWHPRMKDDAAHVWLRSIIREAGKTISIEWRAQIPQRATYPDRRDFAWTLASASNGFPCGWSATIPLKIMEELPVILSQSVPLPEFLVITRASSDFRR